MDLDLDLDLSAIDRMKVSEPTGTERECIKCGVLFRAQRSTAKYCSHACRQAAYAGRAGADPNRECLACDAPIGHKRADALYCDDACRAWMNKRVRDHFHHLLLTDPAQFFAQGGRLRSD